MTHQYVLLIEAGIEGLMELVHTFMIKVDSVN